jgi:hypothetical protein
VRHFFVAGVYDPYAEQAFGSRKQYFPGFDFALPTPTTALRSG